MKVGGWPKQVIRLRDAEWQHMHALLFNLCASGTILIKSPGEGAPMCVCGSEGAKEWGQMEVRLQQSVLTIAEIQPGPWRPPARI
eukprot:scaffold52354_cov19-Tisochrysis_lutea.AAC.1